MKTTFLFPFLLLLASCRLYPIGAQEPQPVPPGPDEQPNGKSCKVRNAYDNSTKSIWKVLPDGRKFEEKIYSSPTTVLLNDCDNMHVICDYALRVYTNGKYDECKAEPKKHYKLVKRDNYWFIEEDKR